MTDTEFSQTIFNHFPSINQVEYSLGVANSEKIKINGKSVPPTLWWGVGFCDELKSWVVEENLRMEEAMMLRDLMHKFMRELKKDYQCPFRHRRKGVNYEG